MNQQQNYNQFENTGFPIDGRTGPGQMYPDFDETRSVNSYAGARTQVNPQYFAEQKLNDMNKTMNFTQQDFER